MDLTDIVRIHMKMIEIAQDLAKGGFFHQAESQILVARDFAEGAMRTNIISEGQRNNMNAINDLVLEKVRTEL